MSIAIKQPDPPTWKYIPAHITGYITTAKNNDDEGLHLCYDFPEEKWLYRDEDEDELMWELLYFASTSGTNYDGTYLPMTWTVA